MARDVVEVRFAGLYRFFILIDMCLAFLLTGSHSFRYMIMHRIAMTCITWHLKPKTTSRSHTTNLYRTFSLLYPSYLPEECVIDPHVGNVPYCNLMQNAMSTLRVNGIKILSFLRWSIVHVDAHSLVLLEINQGIL